MLLCKTWPATPAATGGRKGTPSKRQSAQRPRSAFGASPSGTRMKTTQLIDSESSEPKHGTRRRITLTHQIFIGLAVGILIGAGVDNTNPEAANYFRPASQLFLRLITMIIAPLIFATLVAGIAGAGHVKAVGRMGCARSFTSSPPSRWSSGWLPSTSRGRVKVSCCRRQQRAK
jgi:Sodium:dicarboxylate symporter family